MSNLPKKENESLFIFKSNKSYLNISEIGYEIPVTLNAVHKLLLA